MPHARSSSACSSTTATQVWPTFQSLIQQQESAPRCSQERACKPCSLASMARRPVNSLAWSPQVTQARTGTLWGSLLTLQSQNRPRWADVRLPLWSFSGSVEGASNRSSRVASKDWISVKTRVLVEEKSLQSNQNFDKIAACGTVTIYAKCIDAISNDRIRWPVT